jgi:hypothetical protein
MIESKFDFIINYNHNPVTYVAIIRRGKERNDVENPPKPPTPVQIKTEIILEIIPEIIPDVMS